MVEKYFTSMDFKIAIALAFLLCFPVQVTHYFNKHYTVINSDGTVEYHCPGLSGGYKVCERAVAIQSVVGYMTLFNLVTVGMYLVRYWFYVFVATLFLVQIKHIYINKKYKLFNKINY